MKTKGTPNPAKSSLTNREAEAAEWTEHQHVSEHVQRAARQLVEIAGTPALAPNAIDIAAQRQAASPSDEPAASSATAVLHDDSLKTALEDFETSLVFPVNFSGN